MHKYLLKQIQLNTRSFRFGPSQAVRKNPNDWPNFIIIVSTKKKSCTSSRSEFGNTALLIPAAIAAVF